MAQKTNSELTTEAQVIRNETTPLANTAIRVGDMLIDLIDSKKNNDEYLVYTALLSYDGSTVSVIELKNTLGVALTWARPSLTEGTFRGTASSGTPFTNNKTWLSSGAFSTAGTSPYIVASQRMNGLPTTNVEYRFFYHDGTITGTPNFTNYPIEIRVYP
jgi:hypothetical protein